MGKEAKTILKLNVERPVLEEQDLRQLYQYEKPNISVIQSVKKSLRSASCKGCIENVIPASYWLRKYKWRNDFMYDVISGLTVAIMHIPQGMAYALLGNLTPVIGIYMAFFPVLTYVFLGTSRHVSMGTFAVVCLMTGRAVLAYSTPLETIENSNNTLKESQLLQHTKIYTPIQVATSVTFMVGIIQLIMYVFRLGVISTLLSETFVNGFTTGAAIQVLLSQVFDLLGLNSVKPRGYFKLIKTFYVIFKDIPDANIAAVITSCITCCLLTFSNELIKPWVGRKCKFPLPMELLAVITGTLVSSIFNLPASYNIKTVGKIPTGIPEPQLPAFSLLPTVALESIGITMVSYTVTMSMSFIFAKKLHYDVDSNQELFAMGSSNIFGAFFSCMPISASLSRSLIQQAVGGKTQLASIISCLILLVILLWIGPFFEPLPRCVLASIIVVALKGMLVQAKELAKFWKMSKIDGIVWMLTFISTVVVSIDVGLIVGLLASIASILFQSVRPYSCLLGHVPNTELYLDTSRYIGVAEIFGIKIFHYSGGLNFINAGQLSHDLQEKVGVKPRLVLKHRAKLAKKGIYAEPNDFETKCTIKCIVIDVGAVSKIDSSGVHALREIVADFAQIDISVYLAACSPLVYDKIQRCDQLEMGQLTFVVFATVHDAVFYAKRELMSKS
ncbi:solute carrier family 26 member 6-like isoform X2 [Phymastichus coffea]|nr:solute carrier family 26 member 6-like isoform X2 [Phymastichus coffea]